MTRRNSTYYVGLAGLKGARSAALARDGYRCRYCGIITSHSGGTRTVDHVIPVSMGGRSTIINLVAACKSCNERKGSRSLREAGMVLLPRPLPTPESALAWVNKVRRKCCVHCGLSGRFHTRDQTQPHGEQLRCRGTGRQFFPRDAPLAVYNHLGIDPPKPFDIRRTKAVG